MQLLAEFLLCQCQHVASFRKWDMALKNILKSVDPPRPNLTGEAGFTLWCCLGQKMSPVPRRVASILHSYLCFSFSLFGGVGFLHLCVRQTTHSALICSPTSPFVRTRRFFKSSDTKPPTITSLFHTHSFSFICSLSPAPYLPPPLVSFTSYLISTFRIQILEGKVFSWFLHAVPPKTFSHLFIH